MQLKYKNELIENTLNRLYKMSEISNYQDVYSFLAFFNIKPNNNNGNVNNCFFLKWIKSFNNIPSNISDYYYFCSFENGYAKDNKIKIYIPIDFNNIDSVVTSILHYLSEHKINAYMVIAKEIRTDGVVLTFENKEDVSELVNYLLYTLNYKNNLMPPNPFYFENEGLPFCYNSTLLKYDLCIAHIISSYINEAHRGTINQITIESFKEYVNFFSNNDAFLETLPEMVPNNDEYKKEAKLLVGLFKLSLETNKIEDYYDYIENSKKNNYSLYTNSGQINYQREDKKELLKEFILTTMKKYPLGFDINNPNLSGINYIISYLNGDINSISEENNLRYRVSNLLKSSDIKSIISSSIIPLFDNNYNYQVYYYIYAVMLNEIIRCTEKRFPGSSIQYINEYIRTGNINLITDKIDNARNLAKTLTPNIISSLFNYLGIQTINDYINHYYNKFDNNQVDNWRRNA